MITLPNGNVIFKSYVEYDIKGLHGTPYILIVEDKDDDLMHLYLLNTEDKEYNSIQEWDKNAEGSFHKWHKYALKLQDQISNSTYQ